ncbi:MAG: uroporphyrinogen-III C-methyltransferase [Proteobacteria bacterium]|nr:uroporphyrinogen-III C-methyltransferase [Pseudomonadota bacterium]
MEYLPIFINVKDKRCLVVGGDQSAFGKISLLLKANAQVVVVAPSLCASIVDLKKNDLIVHKPHPFSEDDLERCALVFVAAEDDELRNTVARLARERDIPVNVVDFPELCSFTMPSIIDRSPLLVAVSTGGTSPTLARIIRSRLEAMLPQSYGRLSKLIGDFREKAKELNKNRQERSYFWNMIFASPIIEIFLSGREKEAGQALQAEFEAYRESDSRSKTGQVCLVGAGPGDPDLLTLRALRLIQNADTIVYDRLVFPTILDYARRDAELIYVGKKSADHIVPQEQINRILVDLAKQGKMVVRLKGGDPFIFGRGGEEIERLMEFGVDFQVVPGVTAASGCSTYAGIPLTHRDYAQSCILVTGHLKEGGMDLNWQSLVQPNQTVVFYMGVANIEAVCKHLINHGMSPDMPAAVVQKGTTKNQKVYTDTISSLPDTVAKNNVKPPALIIVGEVVKLHGKLAGINLNRIS